MVALRLTACGVPRELLATSSCSFVRLQTVGHRRLWPFPTVSSANRTTECNVRSTADITCCGFHHYSDTDLCLFASRYHRKSVHYFSEESTWNHPSTGFILSAILGLATKCTFDGLFFYGLLHMPRSFTFGEASIVTQGITIFILNAFLKLAMIVDHYPATNVEKMSTILQVKLLS